MREFWFNNQCLEKKKKKDGEKRKTFRSKEKFHFEKKLNTGIWIFAKSSGLLSYVGRLYFRNQIYKIPNASINQKDSAECLFQNTRPSLSSTRPSFLSTLPNHCNTRSNFEALRGNWKLAREFENLGRVFKKFVSLFVLQHGPF